MIVITTPTGTIGQQVLDRVLAGGVPVRVIVRDRSRLSPKTLERVDVVEGSQGDIDVVNRAFAGADTVFWLCPPDRRAESVEAAYVNFTRPARDALRSQGVRRVVGVSALGRGLPVAWNAGYVTASLAMDDLIASTGVHFRALTMPSFMDNLLRQVDSIKNQGVFFSPISGDRKLPTCATRDIAAVAAKLLLDSSWSGQESVAVLARKTSPSTTWHASCPRRSGSQYASSKHPSRHSRRDSSRAGCLRQWHKEWWTWRKPRTTDWTTGSRASASPRLPPVSGNGARKY